MLKNSPARGVAFIFIGLENRGSSHQYGRLPGFTAVIPSWLVYRCNVQWYFRLLDLEVELKLKLLVH